jgi:hypothetical protein
LLDPGRGILRRLRAARPFRDPQIYFGPDRGLPLVQRLVSGKKAPAMNIPLDYKLLSIEFRNGRPENERRLGFRRATLIHKPGSNSVVIDHVDTPDAAREELLARLIDYELWTIRYEMRPQGYPPIPFCHPFPRGSGVRLFEFENPTADQKNQLYLYRGGKVFFANNQWTLKSVSDGFIPSDQRVYQFYE